MSFDSLALEILHKIIKIVKDDTIQPYVAAGTRLKKTLALTHINRTLRRAALGYHDLWSMIYLEWHADAVQHFLFYARQRAHPDLTVFLDTRAAGTSHKRANHKRWSKFLKDEMKIIRVLGIKIPVHHGSPALAAALSDTRAPRLVTLELDLDEKHVTNANIRRLFNNDAPMLSSTRIHACAPFRDLPKFPALKELAYRVTERNLAGLLDMLRRMPRLTYISLKSAVKWDASPLPTHNPPLKTVVLPSCTSLLIRGMNALRTRYILSRIDFPTVTYLDVHEKMAVHNNGLLATIFETLPRLPNPPQPRDTLWLTIRPNFFIIHFHGYRFQTEWPDSFDTIADAAGFNLRFSLLVDAIHGPANTLLLQPSLLYIENSVGATEAAGLSLGLDDLSILIGEIFESYPTMKQLSLSGNTPPITIALRDIYPHLLPNLELLRIEVAGRGNIHDTYDGPSLATIQRTRRIRIRNDLL
ncbi:hypothetical protein SISNIDRAFT_553511 [Sistotremastrum niveocremeum HHB9708]|uniref:F-box domain-containing protein n=1 Tax=Sistotremastrum niveocremeum HHB9708 TaxID=1314777 RepID=A0A164MF15_9AGAM|nr:hypothetical protein SISNIDRAFT_553511 [Sistotremastrum niveocremeum HHB9708]